MEHIFDSLSWRSFIVFYLVVHEKSEIIVSRMKKETYREKFKPWLLSQPHIAGQSLHEVGKNVTEKKPKPRQLLQRCGDGSFQNQALSPGKAWNQKSGDCDI